MIQLPALSSCKNCGKGFTGRKGKEFCTMTCRNVWHAEHRAQERFCVVCGDKHRREAQTCSPACADKLSAQTQTEHRAVTTLSTHQIESRLSLATMSDEMKLSIRSSLMAGDTMLDASAKADCPITAVAKLATMLCIQDAEFAAAYKNRLQANAQVNAAMISDVMRSELEQGNIKAVMPLSIAAGIWSDKFHQSANNGASAVVEHHHFQHRGTINEAWNKVIEVKPIKAAKE